MWSRYIGRLQRKMFTQIHRRGRERGDTAWSKPTGTVNKSVRIVALFRVTVSLKWEARRQFLFEGPGRGMLSQKEMTILSLERTFRKWERGVFYPLQYS
jgi:hypothetical protein